MPPLAVMELLPSLYRRGKGVGLYYDNNSITTRYSVG